MTDKDYPRRLAFSCLSQIHDDFRGKVKADLWQNVAEDNACSYKEILKEWLKKYQNPKEFDALVKAQHKADESREIMQRNIQQVLGNYDQIEQLLEKSDDISAQSEVLFKTAKKTSAGCCSMS